MDVYKLLKKSPVESFVEKVNDFLLSRQKNLVIETGFVFYLQMHLILTNLEFYLHGKNEYTLIFTPVSKDQGHIALPLAVCPSVCPFVCLVCRNLTWKLNIFHLLLI